MMAASRKVERPGLPPEPFDNHSHSVIDFDTAPHFGKALARLEGQFAEIAHQAGAIFMYMTAAERIAFLAWIGGAA